MRRPALLAVIFFIFGILLGRLINLPVFLLFSFLILFIILMLYFFLSGNLRMANLFLILALFLGGFFRYEILSKDFPINHIIHFTGLDKYFAIEGKIADYPDVREDKTYLVVEVEKISNKNKEIKTCGQILVRIKQPTFEFNYGDRIHFSGYINQPTSKRNPGAFDYRKYLTSKRIFGITYLSQDSRIEIIGNKTANPYYSLFIHPLRKWILKLFDNTLSVLPRALMSGFLLGETRDIPKNIYQMFRDTGTLHLLAVSGSNVGLVILIVLGFLRLLRIPRVYATIVTLAVIVVFANLVQNEPSVVRAGIMAGVALVGLLLYKNLDALNIVSFAALLILVYLPPLLFDVGFQLSFVSVFGIIWFTPKMSRFISKYIPQTNKNLWRWIIYPCIVSLAVELVVIPILAYYFNFVPLVTVVANLFIVPLAGISIFFGCAIIFLGAFSFHLAGLVGLAGSLTLNLTIYFLNFFAHLPISRLKVASPSLLFMFNYYFILILLFEVNNSHKVKKILAFYLVLLSCFYVWTSVLNSKPKQAELTFLDVGRGEAILLKVSNNRAVLFNAGGTWGNLDAGEKVVVPYLVKNGISSLDELIITDATDNNLKSIQSIQQEVVVKRIVNCLEDSFGNSNISRIDHRLEGKQKKNSKDKLLINLIRLNTIEKDSLQSELIKVGYGKITFCLSDKRIYKSIDNFSMTDSCTVLVLPEVDEDMDKIGILIGLFKPKIVLLTSYNFFEKKDYLLTRLKYKFPEIRFYSLRENGAVIFKTNGKNIKTKLTIRE
ncbi:MAG: DNA internalization-related competence protein ComEC/Rec2 [candidate division Zixibacteria bacterium]|nr:DNA internalization-related competence protein ComEC/Rec2 [candidate division Zixibacteria bacterium]